MKLSDIMSAAGLASYAEVGLVLFMIAFFAVAIRVFWFERREVLEVMSRIPLEDASSPENDEQRSEGGAS